MCANTPLYFYFSASWTKQSLEGGDLFLFLQLPSDVVIYAPGMFIEGGWETFLIVSPPGSGFISQSERIYGAINKVTLKVICFCANLEVEEERRECSGGR